MASDDKSWEINEFDWPEPGRLTTQWALTKRKVFVHTHKWQIENASQRLTAAYTINTTVQTSADCSYNLHLKPRDDEGRDFKYVSLEFKFNTNNRPTPPEPKQATGRFGISRLAVPVANVSGKVNRNNKWYWCKFCIVRSDGVLSYTTQQQTGESSSTTKLLFKDFISREVLSKDQDALLPNDTLTILSKFTITADDDTLHHADDISSPTLSYKRNQNSDNFQSILDKGLLSDFTLCVGDKKFPVHRVILAHHSSVFSAMFENNMAERAQQSATIEDASAEVVEDFLKFLYTGNAPHVNTMAEDLLLLAEKYDVGDLKNLCEKELMLTTSFENAVEYLILASKVGLQGLKERTLHLIARNGIRVMSTESWKTLITTYPNLVLEITYEMAKLIQHYSEPPPGHNDDDDNYDDDDDDDCSIGVQHASLASY